MILLNQEPQSVTAGDSVSWLKTLTQFPADDGWQLAYTLINPIAKISLAAIALQADHYIRISNEVSALWQAGAYSWQSRITKDLETYTLATGSITIAASFASLATYDQRTHAQYALDAIKSTLEGRADSATLEYEINGRKMRYLSHVELLELKKYYEIEVYRERQAERIAKGLPDQRRVFVRFGGGGGY